MNLLADPDLQAGEYVLGVLEEHERAAARAAARPRIPRFTPRSGSGSGGSDRCTS